MQKENSFTEATSGTKVELNVTLIGDTKVGKTAFAESFLFGNKVQLYFPTLIDLYACTGLVEFYTSDSIQFKKVKKVPLWITDSSGMLGGLHFCFETGMPDGVSDFPPSR
jgi:GTPase SAR1 family protein